MHGGMQRTLLRPKAEAGVQARHTGEGGGRRGSVDTAGPGTQPEPGPLCLVELTQDDGVEEVSRVDIAMDRSVCCSSGKGEAGTIRTSAHGAGSRGPQWGFLHLQPLLSSRCLLTCLRCPSRDPFPPLDCAAQRWKAVY